MVIKKLTLSMVVGCLAICSNGGRIATAAECSQRADKHPQRNTVHTPGDIVDTAVAAKQFTTLVAAVKEAKLVDTLKGEGPFTVFAPTNKAFEKIPQDKLESLLNDQEALTAVLTYHVVPGKVMAADVVSLREAKTVQGEPIRIRVVEGKVKINDATSLKTDIECSNGVIHVLDGVLLPAN